MEVLVTCAAVDAGDAHVVGRKGHLRGMLEGSVRLWIMGWGSRGPVPVHDRHQLVQLLLS